MKTAKTQKTCKRKECGKQFMGRKNQDYCCARCRFHDWAKAHPRVKVEIPNEQSEKE